MNKVAVLCSGGDSPGMNACIRSIVKAGIYYNLSVCGVLNGYDGLIDASFIELNLQKVQSIQHLGGTILRSARSERFFKPEFRRLAYGHLSENHIDGLIVIGGDGSFAGALELQTEFPLLKIIGIPATIDNDLFGTDLTIGYDTAINTAMQAIDRIRDTADSHQRLFFVEVMGKDAGFIALRSGIGSGADAVLIPESNSDYDQLLNILKQGWYHVNQETRNSLIVIVAEGDEAGGAFAVAEKVKKEFTHFDIKVSILGHILRGGSPTCTDRIIANRFGVKAIELLLENKTGVAVGIWHREIIEVPLEKAIKHNKELNTTLLKLVEVLAT